MINILYYLLLYYAFVPTKEIIENNIKNIILVDPMTQYYKLNKNRVQRSLFRVQYRSDGSALACCKAGSSSSD
jgi:hypothetical protein